MEEMKWCRFSSVGSESQSTQTNRTKNTYFPTPLYFLWGLRRRQWWLAKHEEGHCVMHVQWHVIVLLTMPFHFHQPESSSPPTTSCQNHHPLLLDADPFSCPSPMPHHPTTPLFLRCPSLLSQLLYVMPFSFIRCCCLLAFWI